LPKNYGKENLLYFIRRDFMRWILISFVPVIFLFGCSAPKQITKTENSAANYFSNDTSASAKAALNSFIDGSIAEAKGDYANAIIDLQDALRIEPRAGIYYALAKNYFYLNRLPLALENAKKAIALDSTKIAYYNLLSNIYTTGMQFDSSAIVLNKIISLDSTDVDAYYKLANIYESNKPLNAIEIYNKITKLIGLDWNVLIHVAELQGNLGNFDKAAATIQQLLTIDPGNSALQKLLAEYYQRAKKYDDALKVIDDVISLYPNDLDAHERKAQIYIAENDWKDASKEYSFILEQPSVSFDIKMKIGDAFFEQSFKDSSLTPIAEDFFKKIDKDTSAWQVKMYLGAIAINEKNDSLAIEEFKQASKLASWNVDVWVRLGGLYFDSHKYEEAEKVMKEAYTSFPNDFRVNLILGLSLAQQNKNEDAKPYLKKAVELNPKDLNALSAYAFTLSQLKENDEAIVYLKKALDISPNDVNLLGTLGLVYDTKKNWAACDSIYERALQLDSANALINNNYAYSLSERGIQLDRALNMVNIALKADSNNSAYLDTKGWIYFKMGNYKDAKKFINQALKLGGEKPDLLQHLGDVEYKMGNINQAKSIWEKALGMDKNNNDLKERIEKGII
jgi:tetratricopeptide (TPR) repeat protein